MSLSQKSDKSGTRAASLLFSPRARGGGSNGARMRAKRRTTRAQHNGAARLIVLDAGNDSQSPRSRALLIRLFIVVKKPRDPHESCVVARPAALFSSPKTSRPRLFLVVRGNVNLITTLVALLENSAVCVLTLSVV